MPGQTAVVLGATGMIGEALVKQLVTDPNYSTVRILVRRSVNYTEPKVEVFIVDFSDLTDLEQKLGPGDHIFSCLGTTLSKVKGDQAEYRKIDLEIPVNTAKLGLKNGFKKFLIITAVGANARSGNAYIRLKGEIEEALKQLNYPALHIFQPSLLMGDRKEFRLMEKIVQAVMPVFSVLMFGGLKKFKPIKGIEVAEAMIAAAKMEKTGVFVHGYESIKKLKR